jgi:hypothetical protein
VRRGDGRVRRELSPPRSHLLEPNERGLGLRELDGGV